MAKLVFDIETSALPLEHFDETQQEYLFRECEKIADETARAERRTELTRQCSLWPFTSQVVCIAMLNAESQRGQVLFTAEDFEEDGGEAGPVAMGLRKQLVDIQYGRSADPHNWIRDVK